MFDIFNKNYIRGWISKKSFCKNPPICQDQKCAKNKQCIYGACYIKTFNVSEEYCVCRDRYYGLSCEKNVKTPYLDEAMLLFTPRNELPEKTESSFDCNECLKCIKYSSFVVCTNIKSFSRINRCYGYCDEICGPYICRMRIENKKYYYLEKPLSLKIKKNQ